jgi:hypothetical protein
MGRPGAAGQTREDVGGHPGVFDDGDDLESLSAVRALLDSDVEDALQ